MSTNPRRSAAEIVSSGSAAIATGRVSNPGIGGGTAGRGRERGTGEKSSWRRVGTGCGEASPRRGTGTGFGRVSAGRARGGLGIEGLALGGGGGGGEASRGFSVSTTTSEPPSPGTLGSLGSRLPKTPPSCASMYSTAVASAMYPPMLSLCARTRLTSAITFYAPLSAFPPPPSCSRMLVSAMMFFSR